MRHPVYRVTGFEVVGPHTLRVEFDDATTQVIDFGDVLAGEIYGPLKDEQLFRSVEIDPEVHTLVWPSGADFDPAVLHDWPAHANEMRRLAKRWGAAGSTHRRASRPPSRRMQPPRKKAVRG
ncbi:MAG TPA: DUF2442 domain-containing protein [Candidatus Methylomirabilis sp.]|nr:DUF2442 domain-containing protein [Candidatus Methylomirabilis sp.]